MKNNKLCIVVLMSLFISCGIKSALAKNDDHNNNRNNEGDDDYAYYITASRDWSHNEGNDEDDKYLRIFSKAGEVKYVSFKGTIQIPETLRANTGLLREGSSKAVLVIDGQIQCTYAANMSKKYFNSMYGFVSCTDGSRVNDEVRVDSKVGLYLKEVKGTPATLYASIKISDKYVKGIKLPQLEATKGQILRFDGELWVTSNYIPDGQASGDVLMWDGSTWMASKLNNTGTPGPQGPIGLTGPQGLPGLPGPQGLKGDKGDQGDIGLTGPAGVAGAMGPQGLKGDKGDKGDIGLTGPAGVAGAMGPQGLKGDKGDIGLTGPAGVAGAAGPQGLKGDKGDIGLTGPAGVAGAAGPQGLKGDKGDIGLTGPEGAAGPQGLKGDKGDKGDIGLTGPAGAAGPQGLKGDKGDTGVAGADGAAGAQGLKGDKGDKGDIGLTGASGPVGPQGLKGDTGDPGLVSLTAGNGILGTTILGNGGTIAVNTGTAAGQIPMIDSTGKLAASIIPENIQKIAFIKDFKPNGTSGGTCDPAKAWEQIRDLNSLSGDTSFVTLSANQFTLAPGIYVIEANAPAFLDGLHKAVLANAQTGDFVLMGTNARSHATAGGMEPSMIMGQITITAATTYVIKHRCQTLLNNFGFGTPSNFGVDELYTQMKITKLK